jgi:cytohesin
MTKAIFIHATILVLLLAACSENKEHKPPEKTTVTEPQGDPAANKLAVDGAWHFNLEKVKEAVAEGASVNARDADGSPLVHIAARRRFIELVEFLIARGASVNAKDSWGKSLLHIAAGQASIELAEFLIAKGADVNSRDNRGRTPLHMIFVGPIPGPAVGDLDKAFEVGKMLIAAGADLNVKDDLGWTPLHHVTWYSMPCLGELYIDSGADVNIRDKEGYTPLDYAADRGGGRLSCAGYLRKHGAVQGHPYRIEMFNAIRRGFLEELKKLIAKGADVNQRHTSFKSTTLHMAVMKGRKDIAEYLIAKGAKVNVENDAGRTPLHSAPTVDIAQLLIDTGADPDAGIENGCTPLLWIVLRPLTIEFDKKDVKGVMEVLLKAGADVNVRDGSGKTVLDYAETEEIKKLLLKYGAKTSKELLRKGE